MSAVRLAPARADEAIDALVLELCWISTRTTSSEMHHLVTSAGLAGAPPRGWFAQANCKYLREAPQIEVAVAFTCGAYSIFRPSAHQLAILPREAGWKRTTTVHLRAVSSLGEGREDSRGGDLDRPSLHLWVPIRSDGGRPCVDVPNLAPAVLQSR